MHLLAEIKKEFAVLILVAANKTDLSAPAGGADISMLTLTGEGVEAVKERLFKMVTNIDDIGNLGKSNIQKIIKINRD